MKNLLTCLLILLSGIAFSQGLKERPKRTASVEALIDSAVVLGELRTATAHLKTAYEFKSKEAEEYKEALRVSEMQNIVQRKGFEKQLADRPKGRWWKGFRAGIGTGVTVAAIFIAAIK